MSDWCQMGKIWVFFRSVLRAKIYWKLILKSPKFFPFGANLTHFVAHCDTHAQSGQTWPLTLVITNLSFLQNIPIINFNLLTIMIVYPHLVLTSELDLWSLTSSDAETRQADVFSPNLLLSPATSQPAEAVWDSEGACVWMWPWGAFAQHQSGGWVREGKV